MHNSLWLIFLSGLLMSLAVDAKANINASVSPWKVFTFRIGIRAGCMESEYRDSQSLSKSWQLCDCVMQHFDDALDDSQWYHVTRQVMIEGESLEDIPQLAIVLKKIPLCSADSPKE